MRTDNLKLWLAALAAVLLTGSAWADSLDSLRWSATTLVNVGSGDFAPLYMAANRHGTLTQDASAYEALGIHKPMGRTGHFGFAFGLQAWFGTAADVDYRRYSADAQAWETNSRHPANAWLQEAYAAIRWRSLFLEAGMRDYERSIFSTPTSSGDIVLGTNARGIPQGRIGFLDFVDIPLTRGWVQVQGEIAYGKFADRKWLENHYNRYNHFVTTGAWFHYKRLYLRTNPAKPLSVTIGMQHAAQFGGTQAIYEKGLCTAENKSPVKFKDFCDVFFPRRDGSGTTPGDKAYYNGNHLGAWDLQVRYRLPQGQRLTFYLQSPWEDGSGIGKLNGWDGVWGLRYQSASPIGWLTEASVEYIDFSNMSGPMHWAPGDHPGTAIPDQATGADDYYNNYFYNGWMNNGMGLGSPLVKAPIYNTDGYLRFTDNRIRGFHLGAKGQPDDRWGWRLLTGYQRSLGTPFLPRLRKAHSYSLLLEASHAFRRIPGLEAAAQAAMDVGSIFGHRYGIALSLSYTGSFSRSR